MAAGQQHVVAQQHVPNSTMYNPVCMHAHRYSNVILVDASRSILLCAYQVGGRMSSMRQLQTGGTYQLPPMASGLQPSAADSRESWQDAVTETAHQIGAKSGSKAGVGSALVRTFQARRELQCTGHPCLSSGLHAGQLVQQS